MMLRRKGEILKAERPSPKLASHPRNLPQVSFQEQAFGLHLKELVERSVPFMQKERKKHDNYTGREHICQIDKNARNEFINRLFQLIADILSEYPHSAKSAKGIPSCSSINTHAHGQPFDVNARLKSKE
jgi:hypothetical protein